MAKELIQCSKKVDQKQHYDIYDSSLNLIDMNVDSVDFNDHMCKTSTNIGGDVTRIKFFDINGKVLLDEQGKDISVAYSSPLRIFLISRDNIIQVKKPLNQIVDETELDIQGDYTIFDFNEDGFIKFKRATENSKIGVYKFVWDNWKWKNKITILLKDEYEDAEIVANGTRTIVSKIIDCDIPIIKHGVMENVGENECISVEYDSIIFDGENFIASNYENGVVQSTKFDLDGFYLGCETTRSQEHQKVLKPNSKLINSNS